MLPCSALNSLTMQLISFAEPSVTCAPLAGALLTMSFRISQAMCSATILLSPFVNYGASPASAAESGLPEIVWCRKATLGVNGLLPVNAAGCLDTRPNLGNAEGAGFNRCV